MTVQFIRTTHENGRWRPFPPAAHQFWQMHGGVIGSLLRLETSLTFADLMHACREYALDHISDGPQPEQNQGYVAWTLVHLLQYGMVTAVPPRPTPPPGLDWLAFYPLLAGVAQEVS